MGANKNRGTPVLFLVLVLVVIWWLYKKRVNTQNVAEIQQVTPSNSFSSYSSMTPTPAPPTNTDGSETLTFEFTNLTDQTFSHNLGRLVDVTVVVGGEEVEVNVIYPDSNTVRIQSNSAITGTLIVQ